MAKDNQQGGKPPEKPSSGAKAAVSRANKRAEEAMERLGRAVKKRASDKKVMKKVAHHAGQVATTVSVASTLSYASGRYGDKMQVGGYNPRLPLGIVVTAGGLIAEAATGGHTAAEYATAVGLGTLTSYSCERSYKAGVAAATKAATAQPQPGAAAQPGAAPDALLQELKATPEAKTAGAQRGGRPKRRIEPHPNRPDVPPHLAHLLRRRANNRTA